MSYSHLGYASTRSKDHSAWRRRPRPRTTSRRRATRQPDRTLCGSTSEVIVVTATDCDERARAKKGHARRARRLALAQANDEDRQRLLQFAKELDAEAEAFERGTEPPILRTGVSLGHRNSPASRTRAEGAAQLEGQVVQAMSWQQASFGQEGPATVSTRDGGSPGHHSKRHDNAAPTTN